MLKDGKLINPEIRLENTNKCNASCSICSHSAMKRPKGIMGMPMFVDTVLQANALGVQLVSPFGFGEPLLDSELVRKISFVTKIGLKTFITTNGSLLTHELTTDLLNAGLSHVRFSVHAITKKNFEAIHRGLKWNNVIGNIFDFVRIRDNLKRLTKVSITVIPMNGESVESIKKFWGNLVDDLEIWEPHSWCNTKDYRGRTSERKKTCGRPFSGPVQVQWDGTIIPCCFLTDSQVILGDLKTQSLKQILTGKSYEEFREKHRSGDLSGLPCETCDQLNIQASPLLYSSRDSSRSQNVTSSMKFKIK